MSEDGPSQVESEERELRLGAFLSVLTGLFALLLGIACGGGNKDDADRTRQTTIDSINTGGNAVPEGAVATLVAVQTTAATSTAAVRASPIVVSPASSPIVVTPVPASTEELASSERLSQALVQLSDLGSGWSQRPDNDADDTTEFCYRDAVSVKFKPEFSADIAFDRTSYGPFLTQTLDAYSPADVRLAMDYLIEIVTNCTDWTAQFGANTYTYDLSLLSFPKIGDETFAVRMIVSGIPPFGTLQLDMVYIRRGSTLIGLHYGGYGPLGRGGGPLLEDAARKTVDRLGR
jgi:hypothetical protein